jgi:uncharacterized protein (TIGR00255 family)
MIRSMTGFGQSQVVSSGIKIQIDMKSVNHRYGETVFRMPREWFVYEDKLRKRVQRSIKRGRVDVFITAERTDRLDAHHVEIDWSIAEGYRFAAEEMRSKFSLSDELSLKDMLSLPDIIRVGHTLQTDELLEQDLLHGLEEALAQLIQMRELEGINLLEDLSQRIEGIATLHQEAIAQAPQAVEQFRSRLNQRLDELLTERGSVIDENRLSMEVALMAERSNIDEELTRLASHIRQFTDLLTVKEPVGRKLDFLIQEMNREVNTIGSKASQTTLINTVIDTKAELEKLREQVQNIE